MPYMAHNMQPQLQAGLSDLPLLLILTGVLLCAGIVAVTLSLIRRSQRRAGSAAAGLSPATIALKIAVLLAVLLAAAVFFVTDSGGIKEAVARIKGEPCCLQDDSQPCCPEQHGQPCCTDDAGQPCCPEMSGETSAPEVSNSTETIGDSIIAGPSGEDAIQ